MSWRSLRFLANAFLLAIFFFSVGADVRAQKSVSCPDGVHIEINLKDIAIQYDASSFAGTLSSLSVLSARMDVVPKELQEAATATQQWNEFLKGLVAGYNTCAVTRQQYADGLNRIYPRLKEDAVNLEAFRKLLSNGQIIDPKKLEALVDKFYTTLKEFAHATNQDTVLEKLQDLSEQVANGNNQLLKQGEINTNRLIAAIRERQSPPTPPSEISGEISKLRTDLLQRATEAEQAYNTGFELEAEYRFGEAIPYFEKALRAVPLLDFYLALGKSYNFVRELSDAERVLREGLRLPSLSEIQRARLASELSITLLLKGDLNAALTFAEIALHADQESSNGETPELATDLEILGEVLKANGDLSKSFDTLLRALRINERLYGHDSLFVALNLESLGRITRDRGDLDRALEYSRAALNIYEKNFGPNDPPMADISNNIGLVLEQRRRPGDLDEAMRYLQNALAIDRRVYGPDHPLVATNLTNIGWIYMIRGNLTEATMCFRGALEIDLRAFGPEHLSIARDYNNLAQVLQAQTKLDEALKYTQLALEVDEKIYGPNHPDVAKRFNNIGEILEEQGDLEGALKNTIRALEIDKKVYGADNLEIAIFAANIGEILQAKGDLSEAQRYYTRALPFFETAYGIDDPRTKQLTAHIDEIKRRQLLSSRPVVPSTRYDLPQSIPKNRLSDTLPNRRCSIRNIPRGPRHCPLTRQIIIPCNPPDPLLHRTPNSTQPSPSPEPSTPSFTAPEIGL